MRRPLRHLLLAAALLLATAAPAAAAGEARLSASPKGNPLGISNSKNGVAVLTGDRMLPGGSSTGTVTLTNTGSVDGDFSLEKSALTDRPGAGGGALSAALDLVIDDITSATPRRLYAGKLGGMPRIQLGEFRKRTGRTYRFTVSLPASAGDAVQGSSVSVAFVWTETKANGNGPKGGVKGKSQSGGSGSGGSGDVAGTSASGGSTGELPFTGLPLAALALTGLALAAGGRLLRKRAG